MLRTNDLLIRRSLVGLLLVAAALLPTAASAETLPTVTELTDHMDELYTSKSSHTEMRMEINTENWSRTLEMEAWSKGKDLSVVVIRSPAKEAGTATLRNDEGLWNYAPRADRLMRIPSGMLSDGWMGSHFTNDDLMRESKWQDDFETTVELVEEDGRKLLKLVSVPKADASVVWTEVVNFMTYDEWLPVRAEYYDKKDLVRTMTFTDVKDIGGKKIPTVMTLVPSDKPKEATVVEYVAAEFDIDVKDSLFTARGLRKASKR